MRFRAPSEMTTKTPYRPVHPPTGVGRRSGERYFLSWAFVSYDTYQVDGPAYGRRIPPPPRAARGLDTPSATYTIDPADAEAPERPWTSPFKAFSSRAVGSPLGVPALLTLS